MSHPDRFLLTGVMGLPIMHSRSPKLHGYWLEHYGLAGAYVPLAIKAEGLEAALRALPALGFAGCNLTIPHKEAALGIVDEASPLARRIGAVNCIVVRADGSLVAATDNAADTGSIHALGARLQGAPSCNGWTFWHIEHEGVLKPLDAIRQLYLLATED